MTMMEDRRNPALCSDVAQALELSPDVPLHVLAQRFEVSELAIVRALSPGMAAEAPVERFDEVWEAMLSWPSVTVVGVTAGFVMEYAGPLPRGRYAHGMFNLKQKDLALGGHLLLGKLEAIALVSKPHFGHESHGVHFYADGGRPALAVYVGRDAGRRLIEEALAGYRSLFARYERNS